jgi:glycosyltransferase involved in cell wall biosynthesis
LLCLHISKAIECADRDAELPHVATVDNGIELSSLTFREHPGNKLLFLGWIHIEKGTHLAIEVAKRSGRDLIISGIIQDQQYFDELVRPHLNDSSIQYVGPADPVLRDALFAEACATIHLNTISERFGLVLAESMAAGVPVIAMDLGSCREVVKHGETG